MSHLLSQEGGVRVELGDEFFDVAGGAAGDIPPRLVHRRERARLLVKLATLDVDCELGGDAQQEVGHVGGRRVVGAIERNRLPRLSVNLELVALAMRGGEAALIQCADRLPEWPIAARVVEVECIAAVVAEHPRHDGILRQVVQGA